MDARSFYGNLRYINVVDNGLQSDDDYISESDEEVVGAQVSGQEDVYISETDESSSEDVYDEPSSSNEERAKKSKPPNWKENNLPPYLSENFPFQGDMELPSFIDELETPAEFFQFFFDEDLINFIVEQSNILALQKDINKPANITKSEIEQFIGEFSVNTVEKLSENLFSGIVLYMSLMKLPSSRHYWDTTVGQEFVRTIMTCNRWENIKRFLHFNNNEDMKSPGEDGFDKLFKVRPLLNKIREKVLLIPKEEQLVVDEQIIPTKCRHHLKQYIPAKPHKWGFKNFVLSGVSGFSYDFDIFAGAQSDKHPKGSPNLGISEMLLQG
ncbi:piggyBac transposable element-derived protein 4-like [Bactrocera neohumeralis]|uniref:piggyBac transposable element-derived protein 4-like n=1 Tax=Bactrocera neohumeralis TaxID=98809 RepID=UPI00216569F4|nr:piggyBac transposable element-derived protein 4-like [Bactrocera neohumeralis]